MICLFYKLKFTIIFISYNSYFGLPNDSLKRPFRSYFSYRRWLHTLSGRQTHQYSVLNLGARCRWHVDHV